MRRPTTKTNIILLTLGGLLAASGILFAVLKLLPGKEVPVVAVSDWSIGWMSDDIQMVGPAFEVVSDVVEVPAPEPPKERKLPEWAM